MIRFFEEDKTPLPQYIYIPIISYIHFKVNCKNKNNKKAADFVNSLIHYPKEEQHIESIFEYISKDLYAPESAIKLINMFYNALEKVRY